MAVPRCGDVNEIEIVAFAEILEVVLPVGINFWTLSAAFLRDLLGVSGVIVHRIAKGVYLDVRDGQKIGEHAGASSTGSNNAHANKVPRFKFHANHRLVRRRRAQRIASKQRVAGGGEARTEQTYSGHEKLSAGKLAIIVPVGFIRFH